MYNDKAKVEQLKRLLKKQGLLIDQGASSTVNVYIVDGTVLTEEDCKCCHCERKKCC